MVNPTPKSILQYQCLFLQFTHIRALTHTPNLHLTVAAVADVKVTAVAAVILLVFQIAAVAAAVVTCQ